MAERITAADLDRLEASEPDEDDPRLEDWHRRTAITVESWVTDTGRFSLDPEDLTVAEVTLVAAEHRALAGDVEEALRLGEAARHHPSAEPFEAHAQLIGFHLSAGDVAAARALAAEVQAASAEVAPGLAEAIAMEFDLADRFAEAEQWYTVAVQGLAASGDRESDVYEFAVIGRFRARRELGADVDDLDTEAERFLEIDFDD